MTQPNLLELAKQGDASAIASLMNRQLQPKGITVKVALKDACLQIMLESAQVPNQQALVAFVRKGIVGLGAASIERVKVYGRQGGEDLTVWTEEFELVLQVNSSTSVISQPLTINHETQVADPSKNSTVKINTYNDLPSINNQVSTQSQSRFSQLAVYYFAGIALIVYALLSSSTLGNPVITWLIIIFVLACLVAISTPQGRGFIAKYSQQTIEQQVKQQASTLAKSERKIQIENLVASGLLDASEQIIFSQIATYRGGVRGYPNSAQTSGLAFVLDNSFVFYDKDIPFKVLYERVIEAKLDFFELGGVRGFLALGDVGRQLQQTKNTLELSYLDGDNTERSAKFQINGALTIPGEAEKAREFLNYLLEFKGQFLGYSSRNLSDPLSKIEKLKQLRDQGAISDDEFEAKKRKLLEQL
ncbi:SHOCT domain-containing protein [Nostoc sp.]|uniref:SHOCT domain-containing protein n=1 Tax=Nostoc sp. TaxID=1180 RepID=UPI002FFC7003